MSFLYSIFGKLLFILDSIFHNYGIAIIAFTIIVKLILLPFNLKSTKSMREMQALNPVTQYLQKKYKNSPEKLQRETSLLYQIYHVNPLGGCWPLLLQLPIIWALFGALRNPTQYVFTNGSSAAVNESFLWIPNLNQSDPYFILPILCVVFTFLTQKFTQSMSPQAENDATGGTTTTMMYIMPLMIGFMAMSLPAGVGLYWVVQNIFTFIQQFIMLRKPVKTVSIEEAEAKLAEYSKNKKEEIRVQRQKASEQRNNMYNRNDSNKAEKKKTKVKMTPVKKSTVKERKTITKIPQRKDD